MGSQFVVWSEPWPVVQSAAGWNAYLAVIPASGQRIN
jgi:hypothetical protein